MGCIIVVVERNPIEAVGGWFNIKKFNCQENVKAISSNNMVYCCTSFIQHSMKIVLSSPVLIFLFVQDPG